MSLALLPLIHAKGATSLDATPSQIVVGFGSGTVRIYARADYELERSFAAGKARVDAIQWIPNTDLVAVVCNSRCAIYNLATRRLEHTVGTKSARLIRAHARTDGGRLAVASTYKIRILDFSADSALLSETLLSAPDKQKLLALESWKRDFYVVFGSRPKLWRTDGSSAGFRPVAALHPPLNAARKFVLAAAGGVLLVGSSTAVQFLELSDQGEPTRLIAVLESTGVRAAAPLEAASTQIPLFSVALHGGSVAIWNPRTGSQLLSTPSSAVPCASHFQPLAVDDAIYAIECDVPVPFIAELSKTDLREAAMLALSLKSDRAVDDRITSIQQQYATGVFEQDDGSDNHIETAMRLFTSIEEQEQAGDREPSNHKLVVDAVISPFLDRLENDQQTQAESDAASKADGLSPPPASSTQSVFSARTAVKRKHVLDPVVAYLVYARRHLRLSGSQNQSGGVDTALFRCYMIMRSPLVAPLLRSPNHCDPSIVTSHLLAVGKWRELVWFLRSSGTPDMHRQALDLLVQHNEPPQKIIAYLEQAHTDASVVFEYAQPLLANEPELARRLFFEEAGYDSWEVYKYLHAIDPAIGDEYAMYRVNHMADNRPELHDAVARLLVDNEPALLEFLNRSSSYRPSILVEDPSIPARSRAFLYSKLHNHEAAIDLLLNPVGDWEAAQKEAETYNRTTYLFEKLLRDEKRLAAFLNTVSTNTDLSLPHALGQLEASTSFSSLSPFFTNSVAALELKTRRSELYDAFSRVALTDYSLHAMELRNARYVVTPTTACAVCHKRLGQAVVGVYDGDLVHYGCLERLSGKSTRETSSLLT